MDDVITRAQAVVDQLECNLRWDIEWRDLILALGAGRDLAQRTAKTNQPQGPKYRAAIGAWLRHYGFDRIPVTERSRLISCFDNLIAINAWRSALSAERQEKLNHPRVVLAHWKRSLKKPRNPKKKTAIALADLSPEERAQLIADAGQHIVAQERQLAERRRAGLTKLVDGVRGALLTGAPAGHQVEAIKTLIEEFDVRVARTTNLRDRIAPESHYRVAEDKLSQQELLQRVGRGPTKH